MAQPHPRHPFQVLDLRGCRLVPVPTAARLFQGPQLRARQLGELVDEFPPVAGLDDAGERDPVGDLEPQRDAAAVPAPFLRREPAQQRERLRLEVLGLGPTARTGARPLAARACRQSLQQENHSKVKKVHYGGSKSGSP